MGDRSRESEVRQGEKGERVSAWVSGRLGTAPSLLRGKARKAFPDHWSFMLGEISLYSFVVIVVTGVYLSFFFHPSMNQVVYEGSYAPLQGQLVSEAFNSTMNISFDVRGGLLIRQAHHWAALIFVASLLVHMMRVFFTGAFRKPRELNWVFGFLLLVLAMFGGLTGYDLPDDLLSGTGLMVVNGTILSVPVVGTYLSMFLFGGQFPGDDLIARFNTLHVLIIPALMVGLLAAHLIVALRHRHTQYPGPGRTERNVVGIPFKVRAVKSGGLFLLVAGIILAIAATAQINPVWLYGPYRADQVSAGSQPDWYMGVLDGLIRIMPGWEIAFWGHTLALDNFIPLLAAAGLFLSLGVYPFVEAWVTGDDRDHHVLDRPRNRPVRTGLGVAWISCYLVALIAGANDIIAIRLGLAVESVTWAVRIGIFVVPVLAYSVAYRWALALQRKDRDEVLHGRETGLIKRLPHGEFVEVHEPLPPEKLYVLTQHEQYQPIPDDPAGAAAAPDPGARLAGRLRLRLSRWFYGEGSQVAKPTPKEYQEIAGGHRD
ncbi:ubiquinol-cytochrome c reductase cytochrome b subunit [Streptomyces sp. AS58]|uniref:cytochrome bc1 complex cytochrome b subunit n=1 Tax=Streptomyces TaxID=1883 RepID=UPI0006AF33D3|nr:ubiquinol-cytochrome c reductase cytochrome b subunit [Streptomyces sp. AS58]KOV52701.1 ubiquinol-cytochrome c reductase cytochrome b subunit [Streptomyces sp. AS58]